MLHQIFALDEVKSILSIPISYFGATILFGGILRRAYLQCARPITWKLLGLSNYRAIPPPLIPMILVGIWSLQVPGSVRHFLSRACHEILPNRRNLFHWKVIASDKCPICTRDEETVVHAV